MNDSSDTSEEKLGQLLASYHEQLRDQDAPAVEITNLSAEEREQFQRLRDCLVQLEHLRAAEKSLKVEGEPAPSTASRPTCDNVVGRIGRFAILRELGRGGLGVVFLAHDELLNRQVALKVPRPEVLDIPRMRERFDREAQAAAKLTHPHLVAVYEVGQVGPIVYIVSAYCAGPSLAEWLQADGGNVTPRQAALLVAPLADAVHYAHSQGVLHRDIKPSNVLLEPAAGESEGTLPGADESLLPFVPKLSDFGLARVDDSSVTHTRSGVAIGTFGYMAPEQAFGRTHEIGPATDIHGLGCLLYETLTGQSPYSGDSEADSLRRIVSEEPRRPSGFERPVPRDLEAICMKCLEKDPSRRYRSAADLSSDLQRFLRGEVTLARPATNIVRAWRWARRKPAAAALIAVSLLAAITTLTIWMIYTAQLDRALENSEERRIEADALRIQAETNAGLARDSEARVLDHVYVADMRNAWQRREEGELASLGDVLNPYRPRASDAGRGPPPTHVTQATAPVEPGFEWRYLDRLENAVQLKFKAHDRPLDALVFSAQGDRLLTADLAQGQARLWEMPSGRSIGSFAVRSKPLLRWQEEVAAISPDGKRVATLIDERTAAVWDVERNEEIARLSHKSMLHTVSFLADADQIVGGGDEETIVWDCKSGAVLHRYAGARLVAVCPGGDELAVVDWRAASTNVDLFEVPPGYPRRQLALLGPVKQICYSPDGTMIASLSDPRVWSEIRVHQPRTCQLMITNPGWADAERYSQIGFSGDSRWLAALVADGSMKFWDAHHGIPRAALRGPATRFTRFAFSSGNQFLATATPDGRVLLWDASMLESCDLLRAANEVQGPLAFSGDGKSLAVATTDRSVLLIDPSTCEIEHRLPTHLDPIRDILFSPRGDRLVTTDGVRIRCWESATGAEVWSAAAVLASRLAWSNDSELIAAGGGDRQVHLYNARDGAKAGVLAGHEGEITGLTFLPDTELLVSASVDATVRFWSTSTQAIVGEPTAVDFAVEEIELSPDGKLLAVGGRDGRVTLWDVEHDKLTKRPDSRWFYEAGPRSLLSFSHDAKLLGVSGSTGLFRAIDASAKKVRYQLMGRRVGARSVRYSPDGQTLAAISPEGCLTLWDLDEWETRTLSGSPMSAVRAIAFSADGSKLALATDDNVNTNRTLPDGRSDAPRLVGGGPAEGLAALASDLPRRPWDNSGPGFRLWDAATGREAFAGGECLTATSIPVLAWSSQGILAAGSNDGTVWIWQPDEGKLLARFAVTPAAEQVLGWKPEAGRPPVTERKLKELDPVVSVAFSADGAQLAIATRSGTVQLARGENWDDRVTLSADAEGVSCVAFMPTGEELIASRRGALLRWGLKDLDASRSPTTLGSAENSPICSIAIAHHGRTLAIGRESGLVELVDLESSDPALSLGTGPPESRTLAGHVDRVSSLCFSPDDRTLASGSWDSTVRLWHVESAQEIASLREHHGKVDAVAFSPDGSTLATGGQRDGDFGEVFLWRAASE